MFGQRDKPMLNNGPNFIQVYLIPDYIVFKFKFLKQI